jgi:5-methylcytosine-specific restriction protein B
LPKDWRLIATMNTFDKASLFQLSYAFMRRFAFIEVPIPEVGQFETFLKKEFSRLRSDYSIVSGSGLDAFLMAVETMFLSLFASDGHGLRQMAESLVGPAIPKSMIRYIGQRMGISPQVSAEEAYFEAVTMALLPQFEGRRALHKELVNSMLDPMPNTSRDGYRARLSRTLGIWTGGHV